MCTAVEAEPAVVALLHTRPRGHATDEQQEDTGGLDRHVERDACKLVAARRRS